MSDHDLKCYQAACDEIAELKEKLRVAVEAMEKHLTSQQDADLIEALAKIKGGEL